MLDYIPALGHSLDLLTWPAAALPPTLAADRVVAECLSAAFASVSLLQSATERLEQHQAARQAVPKEQSPAQPQHQQQHQDQDHPPLQQGRQEQHRQQQQQQQQRVTDAPPSSQKRKRGAAAAAAAAAAEQAAAGRAGMGLRHFSLKVCEKVQSKRRTTYNDVADELVAESAADAAAGAPLVLLVLACLPAWLGCGRRSHRPTGRMANRGRAELGHACAGWSCCCVMGALPVLGGRRSTAAIGGRLGPGAAAAASCCTLLPTHSG